MVDPRVEPQPLAQIEAVADGEDRPAVEADPRPAEAAHARSAEQPELIGREAVHVARGAVVGAELELLEVRQEEGLLRRDAPRAVRARAVELRARDERAVRPPRRPGRAARRAPAAGDAPAPPVVAQLDLPRRLQRVRRRREGARRLVAVEVEVRKIERSLDLREPADRVSEVEPQRLLQPAQAPRLDLLAEVVVLVEAGEPDGVERRGAVPARAEQPRLVERDVEQRPGEEDVQDRAAAEGVDVGVVDPAERRDAVRPLVFVESGDGEELARIPLLQHAPRAVRIAVEPFVPFGGLADHLPRRGVGRATFLGEARIVDPRRPERHPPQHDEVAAGDRVELLAVDLARQPENGAVRPLDRLVGLRLLVPRGGRLELRLDRRRLRQRRGLLLDPGPAADERQGAVARLEAQPPAAPPLHHVLPFEDVGVAAVERQLQRQRDDLLLADERGLGELVPREADAVEVGVLDRPLPARPAVPGVVAAHRNVERPRDLPVAQAERDLPRPRDARQTRVLKRAPDLVRGDDLLGGDDVRAARRRLLGRQPRARRGPVALDDDERRPPREAQFEQHFPPRRRRDAGPGGAAPRRLVDVEGAAQVRLEFEAGRGAFDRRVLPPDDDDLAEVPVVEEVGPAQRFGAGRRLDAGGALRRGAGVAPERRRDAGQREARRVRLGARIDDREVGAAVQKLEGARGRLLGGPLRREARRRRDDHPDRRAGVARQQRRAQAARRRAEIRLVRGAGAEADRVEVRGEVARDGVGPQQQIEFGLARGERADARARRLGAERDRGRLQFVVGEPRVVRRARGGRDVGEQEPRRASRRPAREVAEEVAERLAEGVALRGAARRAVRPAEAARVARVAEPRRRAAAHEEDGRAVAGRGDGHPLVERAPRRGGVRPDERRPRDRDDRPRGGRRLAAAGGRGRRGPRRGAGTERRADGARGTQARRGGERPDAGRENGERDQRRLKSAKTKSRARVHARIFPARRAAGQTARAYP